MFQTVLMVLYLLSILSSLMILYMSIYIRQVPKSLYFCYLTLSIFLFNLGYFFEINAGTYETTLMAAKIEYFGIPFLVPFLFLFVCEYCARIKPKPIHVAMIMALPVISALLVFTWPLSDLFYKQLLFETNTHVSRMRVTGGIIYTLFFTYNYILALCAVGIVIRSRKKGDAKFKKQTNALIAATVLPVVGNMINVLKLGDPDYDITPILLSITCLLLGYSIFKHGLYMIEPIAKEQIISNMSDGVILIDMQGNFIDANESAKKIFPELNTITSGAKMLVLEDVMENRATNKETLGDDLDSPETLLIEVGGNKAEEAETLDDNAAVAEGKNNVDADKELTIVSDTGVKKHYRTSQNYIENSGKLIGKCIMIYDVTEAKEHLDEVSRIAEHDALTGLTNRGALYNKGKEAFSRFGPNSNAAILMMDIDFFKKFNDTYGHLNGDVVLKSVADTLSASLRANDIHGRYGGEEFCALLMRINSDDIMVVAEKLRSNVEKTELILDDKKVNVTISIGVSFFNCDRHSNFEEFLADADTALYEAKNAGRNCVRHHAYQDNAKI